MGIIESSPVAVVRTSSGPPAGTADYNLRILWPLARYVEERFGAEALQELASVGGLQPADFDAKNRWVSAVVHEALLAHARSLMGSDEEFKKACVHRFAEAYGPLRYLLWATSPGMMFEQAIKHMSVVSTVSDGEVLDSGPTWNRSRFTFRVPTSRLNCLVRQAQATTMPTLWGLPPAYLTETSCVAHGDAACELQLRWYTSRRWLPAVLGAAGAGLLGWALAWAGLGHVPTPLFMALAGAGAGYLLEVRRAERMNDRTRNEVMSALRELAHSQSDARRELLGMHQRQRDWTRRVEDEMATRASALKSVVSGVQEHESARASTLLGFSHDLRNPLQIIQMSAEYLEANPALKSDTEARESVGDIHQAVDKMRRMLGDLVRVTKAQREFVPMAPQQVAIPALTDGLRRRLRALVHGRDVRTTVFATREVPEGIEIDPLALDRILDNLLTNAAKYTERGGIVVELDGIPGYLVLKVADTGCGIPAESLDSIFEPGGSSPRSRRGDSFGVGLSVVVQLLDQIGGRLEIMSRPGAGTTFWVYLPLTARSERRSSNPDVVAGEDPSPSQVRQLTAGGAMGRVVRVRRAQG